MVGRKKPPFLICDLSLGLSLASWTIAASHSNYKVGGEVLSLESCSVI